MVNVFIGKKSITGKGLAICKVIDCDIATGDGIIYNRETDCIEKITLAEKHTLYSNIKKLAEALDQDFIYLADGVASKEAHSKEEFDKWLSYIANKINNRIEKLKQISSNEKLIAKYVCKANKLKEM